MKEESKNKFRDRCILFFSKLIFLNKKKNLQINKKKLTL